ncbi:ATP/GTP-binding protein [Streptomyces filipinensis]
MMSWLRGRRAAEPGPEPGAEESGIGWQDGNWTVRKVAGAEAKKTYRCPGCDQVISPGVPHLVAWPTHQEDRLHWHTACWNARDRRSARTRGSRTTPSAEGRRRTKA